MAFNPRPLKLSVIQKGSTGAAVAAWQRFLQVGGFPIGAVDGDFGNICDVATRRYQEKNELPADGVVGPGTYTKALTQGFIFYVPNLTTAMLLECLNFGEAQVKDLQQSLNAIAKLSPSLATDGDFGLNSTRGLAEAYKKIDVNFRPALAQQLSASTKLKLGSDFDPALDTLTEYTRRQRQRLSGAHWVKYFLASTSIDDLASPFRQRVQAFEKALRAAGATIEIANTLRPPERAYLMHYASRIARGDIAPQNVPSRVGVDISWLHYTNAAAIQAAQQMAEAYDIAYPPALQSRHTEGLAIDWLVTWQGTLNVKDANGKMVSVGTPRSSYENQVLWRVGATYRVIKLDSDRPHWSIDGH
ncbi:peptidoglycan-binding protein [Allocoleopsis sp.]|uniref:peptidoglycan-binding domain-containing protein n=1 Tax=Allocoleopsis sp. TaxID=3088169 RepID=UPI002FD650D9